MRVEYDLTDPWFGLPQPVDQWLPGLRAAAAIQAPGVDGSRKNQKAELLKVSDMV